MPPVDHHHRHHLAAARWPSLLRRRVSASLSWLHRVLSRDRLRGRPAEPAQPLLGLSESETILALDAWFTLHERSLAAYLSRRWRFRHGVAIYAASYAVGPLLLVSWLGTQRLGLLIAGLVAVPLTPLFGLHIVAVQPPGQLRALLGRHRGQRRR